MSEKLREVGNRKITASTNKFQYVHVRRSPLALPQASRSHTAKAKPAR
ncbi:hypothetical protein [Dendronalium sp. ChiSLP03b]|nr:hypothetical protein [Dendronalium sp. ChiSLP03b]MDZ8203936.1 hypothetical protein [Dendronalium sp. ChiSLP03b]